MEDIKNLFTFALAFAFFVVFAYRNRSLEDLHRERQVVRYAVLLICFIWFCYSVKRVRGSLLFFIWDFFYVPWILDRRSDRTGVFVFLF